MSKMAEEEEQIEVEETAEILEEGDNSEQVGDEDNSVADQNDEQEGENNTASDDDEIVVSIGEEPPPPEENTRAPEWVRELRRADREKARRIKELEAKLNAAAPPENNTVTLGAKPRLEDFDYDADQYETALSGWFERKRIADHHAEVQRQAEKAQHDAWQARLESYGKAKAELKVRDFEDAEAVVQEVLDVTQQGIVVQGADNPALVIYALGKNEKKAKEISSIKDPVKFAFAVAKLEKELKVTNRKAAPPPERTMQGTGRVSGAVDSTLERLRSEAEKTGNYTKVIQYKQQKRAAK